jgi:predicted nucleotidyltransferase
MHCLAEEDRAAINRLLQKALDPCLIMLFGSCVKGSMRQDSDVDIAFLSVPEYNAYEVFMTAQELAAVIGRDVDLVDLHSASTVMKAQIVSSGRVIYCSDEARRMIFFMNTLKEYALLNERRQPVLAGMAGAGGGGR